MEVKEIEERLIASLVKICPEREKIITDPKNTFEEHLEFLEILAVYIPFDKEAACREAYAFGRVEGGKK